MRLLAASGERNEALSHYTGFQRLLCQELDAEPEQATHALYTQILQEESRPLPFISRRHNLPAALSPLIGRETELAELQQRLLDPACRLLTVLGPGGRARPAWCWKLPAGLVDHFAGRDLPGFICQAGLAGSYLAGAGQRHGLMAAVQQPDGNPGE